MRGVIDFATTPPPTTVHWRQGRWCRHPPPRRSPGCGFVQRGPTPDPFPHRTHPQGAAGLGGGAEGISRPLGCDTLPSPASFSSFPIFVGRGTGGGKIFEAICVRLPSPLHFPIEVEGGRIGLEIIPKEDLGSFAGYRHSVFTAVLQNSVSGLIDAVFFITRREPVSRGMDGPPPAPPWSGSRGAAPSSRCCTTPPPPSPPPPGAPPPPSPWGPGPCLNVKDYLPSPRAVGSSVGNMPQKVRGGEGELPPSLFVHPRVSNVCFFSSPGGGGVRLYPHTDGSTVAPKVLNLACLPILTPPPCWAVDTPPPLLTLKPPLGSRQGAMSGQRYFFFLYFLENSVTPPGPGRGPPSWCS